MFQIYFLTVLTNILAGLTISSKFLSSKIEGFQVFSDKMENRLFRVILGSVTLLTGLFSLLNHSDVSIAILGNLVPAVTAMAMGLILIIYYFFSGGDQEENHFVQKVKDMTEKYGNILGIAGIIVGLIHFLIPTALFL
jgi:purine-cytosine permease-like protein